MLEGPRLSPGRDGNQAAEALHRTRRQSAPTCRCGRSRQRRKASPSSRRNARRFAAQATAAEIARLITEGDKGRITIGERTLEPGDIAVLVRTHAQGSEVKRELAALDIGSVELSQASVFQSPDAEEVERVLIAINQPSRDALLRGALATEMMGRDAARVAADLGRRGRADGLPAALRRLPRPLAAPGRGRHVPQVPVRRKGQRPHAPPRRRRAPSHQPAAPGRADPPGGRDARIAGRAAALAGDEAPRRRRRRSRAAAPRIRPQSRPDRHHPQGEGARIRESCSARSCGTVATGSAGRSRKASEYHDADGEAVIDFRSRRRDRRRAEGNRRRDQARGVGRVAAPHLRGADARGPSLLRDCRHVHGRMASAGRSTTESTKSLLNWLVAGGNESPQSWFDGKRSPADIAAAWQALATRLSPHLALAPLPVERGTPVALARSRTGIARRPAPAEGDRARVALQQLFAAFPATRRAKPPRTTTTRGSRTWRRASARRRRTSRRTTSCAFRAAPAPASACTRSSSTSTSPPRPAGTTPSAAACPRIRNSFPACARPSNRRCSRA